MSEDSDNKVLLLAVAIVLVLGMVLGGGFLYVTMMRTQAARAEAEAEAQAAEAEANRVAAVDACARCLPQGLTMEDKFADKADFDDKTLQRTSVTTVKQKLLGLRAYCKDGNLYDGEGKRILFYWVIEVGGPQKANQNQERVKQAEEMQQREQQGFTVIRMWRTMVPI
jgi:hypothetical protein